MHFEVHLPDRHDTCVLRSAGLETDAYHEQYMDVLLKGARLPVQVSCRYFLSDKPVTARVTVFRYSPDAHLKIEVDDAAAGKRIRQHLMRYSAENDGAALMDREHQELWAKIETILKRDDLSYDKLQRGAVLTRRALESLMRLCEKTERIKQSDIHGLFTYQAVAKSDRAFTAHWLLELLETERDPSEQISVRIYELAVLQIAQELIHFVGDPRNGDRRGLLCLALAKTRHPRAAAVIASVLDSDSVTRRLALEALGSLKAVEHAKAVQRFLCDKDADVRREARKTLKKLGVTVQAPSAPVHVVKSRGRLPRGLEEWSQNLDMWELDPLFEVLADHVDQGFGAKETAEVLGVVEEMRPDQTKAFRFPIVAHGKKSELWLIIFMDDVDSPDLGVYADSDLIRGFSTAVERMARR